MKQQKPVSIKDIARLSGVSVSTVSRVLNASGRYSKETERKVQAVIASTGYKPSPLATGMRSGRARSIGVIVPDITNEFFASITLALQTALFEEGYATLICNTNEQPSVQAGQLEMLADSRVSGIVFISGEDISAGQLADDTPKVFVDRVPWNAKNEGSVTVEVDNFAGGALATGALLDAGCRRVLALFDGRGFNTQVARYSGYLRAHQDRGLDIQHELYLPVPSVTFEEGYKGTQNLLRSGANFDGMFCYSDLLAFGALRALWEAGVRVPDDVMMVGFDDISPSGYAVPSLTTVAQPVREMGELAARLILQMQHGAPDQTQHLLAPKLIRRESTGPATNGA